MAIRGLSMKFEFEAMTLRELKQYVLEHQEDLAAFQALMDRIDARSPDKIYGDVDAEQFAALLKQHYPSQRD